LDRPHRRRREASVCECRHVQVSINPWRGYQQDVSLHRGLFALRARCFRPSDWPPVPARRQQGSSGVAHPSAIKSLAWADDKWMESPGFTLVRSMPLMTFASFRIRRTCFMERSRRRSVLG
jgi:hypothetical protein